VDSRQTAQRLVIAFGDCSFFHLPRAISQYLPHRVRYRLDIAGHRVSFETRKNRGKIYSAGGAREARARARSIHPFPFKSRCSSRHGSELEDARALYLRTGITNGRQNRLLVPRHGNKPLAVAIILVVKSRKKEETSWTAEGRPMRLSKKGALMVDRVELGTS